jgi:hypothetical protein
MRNFVFITAIAFIVSGCASTSSKMAAWAPPTAKSTTIIDIAHKGKSPYCAVSTKSKTRKCKKHRIDETCHIPGDTITWQWKGDPKISQKFKITPKSPFTLGDSPFDPPCDSVANQITCTISATARKNSFYEYNIEVVGEVPACNLDPRLLIY